MALTMTRTRTQTTLTKLAEMVANVHGELVFLEGPLAAEAGSGALGSIQGMAPEGQVRLAARQLKLLGDRDALYATIRQFDAGIDPKRIGSSEGWRKQYERGLSEAGLVRRYLARTAQTVSQPC